MSLFTETEEPTLFHRSVLEAASWRLASSLVVRHPHLRVFRLRTHDGIGDELLVAGPQALEQPVGLVLYLNRAERGRIHLVNNNDGASVGPRIWRWDDYLTTTDPSSFVSDIELLAGLPLAGGNARVTDPHAMTYQVIAALTGIALLKPGGRLKVGCGYEDGSGAAGWWRLLRQREPEATAPRDDDAFGEPAWRFWRIEGSRLAVTIDSASCHMWATAPGDDDLGRGSDGNVWKPDHAIVAWDEMVAVALNWLT